MYYGIIEAEALNNKDILKKFNIIKSYKEKHLDENPPIWTINKVKFNEESLIEKLPKFMLKGWYSLLWNNDFVYVIFKNKIFKIQNAKPWKKEEFNKVVSYALSVGINKKYFDNLRKSIEMW